MGSYGIETIMRGGHEWGISTHIYKVDQDC